MLIFGGGKLKDIPWIFNCWNFFTSVCFFNLLVGLKTSKNKRTNIMISSLYLIAGFRKPKWLNLYSSSICIMHSSNNILVLTDFNWHVEVYFVFSFSFSSMAKCHGFLDCCQIGRKRKWKLRSSDFCLFRVPSSHFLFLLLNIQKCLSYLWILDNSCANCSLIFSGLEY